MIKEELIERSPLRILEKSMHGELATGKIGVFASRKGVGKTACLVHVATDSLFQGKHVIHVSFAGRTDHIVSWYEDIFKEIARKRELDDVMDVHDELVKNRVIMNFNQDGFNVADVIKSLRTMIAEGHFNADLVIVDGLDFAHAEASDLQAVKEFANDLNVAVWFSATIHREDPDPDDRGVPHRLSHIVDELEVLVTLAPKDDYTHMNLVKDHDSFPGEDLHLKLDNRTMLIAEA